MKIGLVTTTINIPRVLANYKNNGGYVIGIFVAADLKTPPEAEEFCDDLRRFTPPIDVFYYTPEQQKELGYESSELIGWNTDSRRNIAVLEALKWGAEIIASVDDDMIPLGTSFFDNVFGTIMNPFSGLKLGRQNFWFDAGQYTVPPARQRGLPLDVPVSGAVDFVIDAKIGVVQGTIVGVPDTDALTAGSSAPYITGIHEILRTGFVADPLAKAVFNSQFVAFRRELAPAFAQFYRWHGRNTDIVASLLMCHLARARGLHTFYGPPIGYHARQPRPVLNDLKAEMFGLEMIAQLADKLSLVPHWPAQESTLDTLHRAICSLPSLNDVHKTMLAWLRDCDTVL